jgi:hypothetical protein
MAADLIVIVLQELRIAERVLLQLERHLKGIVLFLATNRPYILL